MKVRLGAEVEPVPVVIVDPGKKELTDEEKIKKFVTYGSLILLVYKFLKI